MYDTEIYNDVSYPFMNTAVSCNDLNYNNATLKLFFKWDAAEVSLTIMNI